MSKLTLPSALLSLATVAALGAAAIACASPAGTNAAAKKPGEVAATVGGRTFTLDEVDRKFRETDPQTYNAIYQGRKNALDQLIEEHLVELEAKARGVTAEKLLETEITAKASNVTDEQVQAFYQERQAQMGGQTFEQVAPRIRQFLAAQALQERRQTFIDSLRGKTSVQVMLDPPRVEVPIKPGEAVKGPAKAPIEIVEYSDFQCPFCSRVNPTIAELRDTYKDKIRMVFRHYPLPMHQQAPKAAEASECAEDQGKFWEYHDKLFANQQALGLDQLKSHATDLGLDRARFDACLDGGEKAKVVMADMQQGSSLGVQGTPAFFINGRFLSGAQPAEAFKEIIEDELKRQSKTASK